MVSLRGWWQYSHLRGACIAGLLLPLVVACTSESATVSPTAPVAATQTNNTSTIAPTASVEESTSTNASAQTKPSDAGDHRCMEFAPDGYPTFFTSENVTINDIRAIRVGTLPPTPTSLLLPERNSSEGALMCWATDDAKNFVQYWIAADGTSETLCRFTTYETLRSDQVGSVRCF